MRDLIEQARLLDEQIKRRRAILRQTIQDAAKRKAITPETVEAYAALHLKNEDDMPITPARHHRLWLDFLCNEDIKRLMIIAPFGSAKTTWTLLAYVGCYVGVFPERATIIACNSGDTAVKRSLALRSGVLSDDFKLTFPDLEPDPSMQWQVDKWTLRRKGVPSANRVDPTLTAYGAGGAVIGSRGDLIIPDDLLDYKNTRTPHLRQETTNWLHSTLLSRQRNEKSRVIAIGTSWSIDDYYAKAKKEGGWVVVHMPMLSETDDFFATITYPSNFIGRTMGEPIGIEVFDYA